MTRCGIKAHGTSTMGRKKRARPEQAWINVKRWRYLTQESRVSPARTRTESQFHGATKWMLERNTYLWKWGKISCRIHCYFISSLLFWPKIRGP